MEIEYDRKKCLANIEQRGLSFDLAAKFDMQSAMIWMDLRKIYGEPRFNALGLIGPRLHHMTFTVRGCTVRIISLRKANQRELKKYAERN